MGFGTIALGALFVLTGLAPAVAHATQPNPEHKVTLCHRTDSYSNPYVRITVDVASVLHQGHDDHNGPVFYASIPKHTKWGDIIPPFDYGPHEQYGGQNWTAQGTTVFDSGCTGYHPTTTTTTCPPKTTTTKPPPTTTTTVPATTTTSVESTTTTSAPTTTTTNPESTTTTSSVPGTTTSSVATTSTTFSTVTTAGNTTTTAPGATTTTTVTDTFTAATSPTTAPPGTDTSLPFTGGSSDALIVAGLVLIAAGLGLTRRTPLQP